jgi:hypothetical protein
MKRQYELTYIPIGPATRVIFFLNLIMFVIMGFIYGIFFAAVIKMGLPINDPNMPDLAPGMMLIAMPIAFAFFGGVIGTLFYVVFIWLYNMIARFTGGVVLELESTEDENQRPRPIMPNAPPPSSGPNPLPWSMPSNMSSTIGGPSDAPYRPPTSPTSDESGRQG